MVEMETSAFLIGWVWKVLVTNKLSGDAFKGLKGGNDLGA